MTTQPIIKDNVRSSHLIPGLLVMLFFTVLASFGIFLLRVLGLGLLGSLLFLSAFAFGMALGDVLLARFEPRASSYKLTLPCAGLAVVLALTGLRSSANTSPLELALYLAVSGLAFGLCLPKLYVQFRDVPSKWWLVLAGVFGVLLFGLTLNAIVKSDFAARASNITKLLSIDAHAQLEVLNPQPTLGGLNPVQLKTQLKTNLTLQLKNLTLALSKNQEAAKRALLENPATPSAWRTMLEGGGLKALSANHFLRQKINLEKALRDEDPKAIRDLLFSSEIPGWIRSDLARGGLKDWVHRQFDVQRSLIERAIQNSDQQAIKSLLKNPQTRPELRVLLEQGGVRASIEKRLAHLRLALKTAIQTGDLAAVSLVYQHPLTPKSIREIFKDGALQPQTKLEIALQQDLIVQAFVKADPQAIKRLRSLGVSAKPNLPADFTVSPTIQASRAQRAIKELLEKAEIIRNSFLTRRTLLDRAIQNGDQSAIKTLCPECEPAPTTVATTKPASATTNKPTTNKPTPNKPTTNKPTPPTKPLEQPKLPESLKVYLQRGGLRAQINANYTAQYQILEAVVNSGDITRVIALLENPDLPSDVGTWITKLNLKDLETPEAQAASLKKVKSILDDLQQTETRNAVLAALEVVNQSLKTFEEAELNTMIDAQVVSDALQEALPTFDAAASKIETRAVDVALQGTLIALTVNEKAAGNLAVQTLIDRAQHQLAKNEFKTIKTILKSTLKTARDTMHTMWLKLEHVIDALVVAEKEAFGASIRKCFGMLAILALLTAGLAYISSRRNGQSREKSATI